MDLISVIVPIYKVEKYLDQCVESIVNQTYKNLEIILVDDGSPDNCPQMCDDWAEKEKRIKVVHKKNGGLSDARNAGLEIATGDYIAFVDSDDWIEKKYIEYLYQAIISTGADMSACDVRSVDEGHEVPEINDDIGEIKKLTPKEALGELIKGRTIRAVAWNKLYRANLIINEKFEVGKLHEDEFFTYRIIDKCQSLAYINVLLYNYLQRSGSIMSTYSIRHLDSFEAGIRRLEFLKGKYPDLYHKDKATFCKACVNYYCDTLTNKFTDALSAQKTIKNYRRQMSFSLGEFMRYKLKDKLYIIISHNRLISLFAKLRVKRKSNV